MMSWCLLSCAAGCNELYELISNKNEFHSNINFSGYLLTYIHHKINKNCRSARDYRSPFSAGSDSLRLLYTKVFESFDDSVDVHSVADVDDPDEEEDEHDVERKIARNESQQNYYCFGPRHLKSILPAKD